MKGTALYHAILTILSVVIRQAQAQQCYYPNGVPVTGEPVGQCYPWGGACCPVGWTCLSNNLCTYKNQTGRYSCVDSGWGDSCPSFCRDENDSDGGNQAVQYCGSGNYCCNGRGLEQDQCCETGTSFFKPGPAQPMRTISTAANNGGSTVAGESIMSVPPAGTTTERTMKTTKTTQSVLSSEGQVPTTVQVTIVSTSLIVSSVSSAAESPSPPTASHSNETMEKAVGIPVGITSGLLIIAGGCFAYSLWQRRRKRKHPSPYDDSETFKYDPTVTGPNSPAAGEFVGLSPVSAANDMQPHEALGGGGQDNPSVQKHGQNRISELSGTEILQLHGEPQIAELPEGGSRKE